jgi:hypothetical protein
MPSVAGMLHMMGDYTYKGPDRKNGNIFSQTQKSFLNVSTYALGFFLKQLEAFKMF